MQEYRIFMSVSTLPQVPISVPGPLQGWITFGRIHKFVSQCFSGRFRQMNLDNALSMWAQRNFWSYTWLYISTDRIYDRIPVYRIYWHTTWPHHTGILKIQSQNQLSGICYDFDEEEGAAYHSRRSLLLMPRLANGWYRMATAAIGRSLMASATAPSGNSSASNPPSNYGGSSACGPNQQPLWNANLQHETHLFLFAVALTHIFYSTLTLIMGKFLVRISG